MGLSSESSCKFLGDAQPDPAQGHCPRAPCAEAQLPPRAATKPRAAPLEAPMEGHRAMSLPCPTVSLGHRRPALLLSLATGDTLEQVEFLCCTPHLFFCSVFKCHVYPGQACCCARYTDFPCMQVNAGSCMSFTTSARRLCSSPTLQLPCELHQGLSTFRAFCCCRASPQHRVHVPGGFIRPHQRPLQPYLFHMAPPPRRGAGVGLLA